MAREPAAVGPGATLVEAVDAIFGRPPFWPWSGLAVIVAGGAVGAMASWLLAPNGAPPDPALRWAACAGYGMVVAAFLTVLPRVARVAGLRRTLARRPERDGDLAGWWPLQLLAAALRGTPPSRRTQNDFAAAVDRAAPEARSILTQRLWPACVAAFATPVLGLLSAWAAGRQIEVVGGQTAADIVAQFVPLVSPPMVATIAAALALVVVLAILDQATKGLLQRWATTVQFADGDTEAARRLIGDPAPLPPVPVADGRAPAPRPPAGAAPPPRPAAPQAPSADDLERLLEEFPRRG